MFDNMQSSMTRIATRNLRDSMRALGAVSPATSIPAAKLPSDVVTVFDQCIMSGIIREGPTGRYYLFDPPGVGMKEGGVSWSRERLVKAILFWLLVIVIPFIVIQFAGRGASSSARSGSQTIRITR